MSEIDMGAVSERPEGGVEASFELKKGDDVTVVKVHGASYLDIAKALRYVGQERVIADYLTGVSDPDGWEDSDDD